MTAITTDPGIVIRPLTDADVPAARDVAAGALDGVSRALDRTPDVHPSTPASEARGLARMRHVLEHDPGGAWAADRDGEVVGVCLAIRRGELWMLSLLVVAGGLQGTGIGARLLEAGRRTEPGATSGLILSSRDPRAMRRYHRAGFALHPAYDAEGELDRSLLPAGLAVREGDLARDEQLCQDVAHRVRGSRFGPDIAWMTAHGCTLLVAEDGPRRGFALVDRGRVMVVGADDDGLAARLLWAAIGSTQAQEKPSVGWVTGQQQWAVDVAMAARLSFSLGGSVAMKGALGPMCPYLPSGIWG